ncbi:MAG: hypothetical protein AUF67_09535 [Acidobacteria bacterium 13_1_20CM_58_21]|nr:MAG: hypothetical protein AUF67_09535 [Acidobacteria bacterium 13_1_20CM_58_21]
MATKKPLFTRETFQFFKDLGRHNRKEWMDANRDRYQTAIIQPFRRLLEELTCPALELDSRFDTSGRTGPNFSRINRDIRFAKDKTLYKTHMYLKFSVPAPGRRETGQLYVRVHTRTDCRAARKREFRLGRKTTEAPRSALRKLLVHHGERRMDEAFRLAHCPGEMEKDIGVDRPP